MSNFTNLEESIPILFLMFKSFMVPTVNIVGLRNSRNGRTCQIHACCGGIARRFAPYWLSIHVFASILCMKTALCVSRNSYIHDQDTMYIHVFSSSYEQPGLSMCILNTMVWHMPLSGAIFTRYLDINCRLVFLVVLVRFEASISTKIRTISTKYLHIACI